MNMQKQIDLELELQDLDAAIRHFSGPYGDRAAKRAENGDQRAKDRYKEMKAENETRKARANEIMDLLGV